MKGVLRETVIALSAHIKKKNEDLKINNPSFHLGKLKKKGNLSPKQIEDNTA